MISQQYPHNKKNYSIGYSNPSTASGPLDKHNAETPSKLEVELPPSNKNVNTSVGDSNS